MYFFVKLGRHVNHGERTDRGPYRFWRSEVNVTMGIYGDKLVNTKETKLLCISSSNLAEMLITVRGLTLLILEVSGQGHSGHVWK